MDGRVVDEASDRSRVKGSARLGIAMSTETIVCYFLIPKGHKKSPNKKAEES